MAAVPGLVLALCKKSLVFFALEEEDHQCVCVEYS